MLVIGTLGMIWSKCHYICGLDLKNANTRPTLSNLSKSSLKQGFVIAKKAEPKENKQTNNQIHKYINVTFYRWNPGIEIGH